MHNPFVSIIIPHRGPKELLDKCLASIPDREDLETIVVPDEDARGAGWGRNRGLEKAKGEYIVFADSDDFFHPCFSEFLDSLRSETADMVLFNADSIELDTGKPSWRANHLNRIMRCQDRAKQEKHLRFYFTEPWCRAVKKTLIENHHIRFSETKKNNDIFFTAQVGYYAGGISANPRKCYCIGNRKNSTAKSSSDEKMLHVTREAARTNAFLMEKGVRHIHSRMMRPFIASMLRGRLFFSYTCWKEMKAMGLSTTFLLYCLLRYPRDLVKLIYRKIQSGEI